MGAALVAHPATRMISFTGSTATGKKIMAAAAADLKRTPWGGFKQSGLGRRYGELGLEPFFAYKTVWV